MGKRILLVFGLALIAWTMAHAEQVSVDEAQSIASRFMAQRGMGTVAMSQPLRAPRSKANTSQQEAAYYVFNAAKDRGFVIVSGDDRTEQVLGYSDKGNFDPENVPENMQAWLDQYVEEIALLDEGVITVDRSQSDVLPKAGSAVSPLLTSQWGQGTPFKFQCPQYNGSYCVTGCVATAMAQIMYYHQWPSSTSQTIPGYTQTSGDLNGTTYNALGTTTFNWNIMKDYYSSSETSTTDNSNNAVARLMRYCGQAVETKYGVNSSGAVEQSEVFVDYFRYSPKARKLYRFDYSYSQWESLILNELRSNRPLFYGGYKHKGGHAFVCDGYDGNGYYHFNWGWRGDGDGYFLLTSLNPDASGIGSAAGNNGYTIGNDIIIGLEPNTVSTSERNSVIDTRYIQVESTTYTRNSSSEPFLISISCRYYNPSYVSRNYDMSWGIYNSTGFYRIATYGNPHNATLVAGNITESITRVLQFGKDYGNGTYYLRPICRENGSNQWLPCHYSGLRYIKAVINGNTLTLTPVNKGINDNEETTEGVSASFYEYSTIKKVNRPLEVKVKVTNTSLADYLYFYLWANNKLVGANSINLNGASSGYVTISYTPMESGTNNLKLTADRSGNYVYCTSSVSVDALSAADLSMTITGGNTYNNQTTDNYLYFRLKVTNNLTSPYNDYLISYLYKEDKTSGQLHYYDQKAITANIAASGSTTANFTFSKLNPGIYKVYFYYYNYNSTVYALGSGDYQVMARGDVNGDGTVTAADVTALYDYLLNNDSSNIVNGDQDGDGHITAGDITTVYSIMLGN
jgi:hypothetical protein